MEEASLEGGERMGGTAGCLISSHWARALPQNSLTCTQDT